MVQPEHGRYRPLSDDRERAEQPCRAGVVRWLPRRMGGQPLRPHRDADRRGGRDTPDKKPLEAAGPNLFGLHSRAFYVSFMGNPKTPLHMGAGKSQMPRFDAD